MLELLIVLFIVSLGTYNSYIMKCENQEHNNTLCNKFETTIGKISLYAFISLSSVVYYYTESLLLVLFCFSSFILFYDGIVNMLGKKKPFFYVGNTLYFEKVIRYLFCGRLPYQTSNEASLIEAASVFKILLFIYTTLFVMG